MAMVEPVVVETPEIEIVEPTKEQLRATKQMAKLTKQFPELAQELNNRRGFCDLRAERSAYYLGRTGIMLKMNNGSKKERKTASDLRKTIRESIPQWITDGNIDEYNTKTQEAKDASKIVSDMNKPFRTQIKPLSQAIKFIDNTAEPALLAELGYNVEPAITLSDLITKKLEEQKN